MKKIIHRVLEISRDSHFLSILPSAVNVTWIPTGSSLSPGFHLKCRPHINYFVLVPIFFNLMRNHYDLIVLPAIHEDWHHDSSKLKKFIRSCLVFASRRTNLAHGFNFLLGLPKSKVIIFDHADSSEISNTSIKIFPYFDLYFKRHYPILKNSLEIFDPDKPHHFTNRFLESSTIFRYLPMALDCSNYQNSGDTEKTHDVFFACELSSDHRRYGLQVLKELKKEGYAIDIADRKLPFDVYLTRLSRARITLSPEGTGYQCWRHYESLLSRSVPLINRPSSPLALCLKDQESCLYYSSNGNDLKRVLVNALTDREGLSKIATRGRDHVLQHHKRESVAIYILNELNVTCPKSFVPSLKEI